MYKYKYCTILNEKIKQLEDGIKHRYSHVVLEKQMDQVKKAKRMLEKETLGVK